MKKWGALLLAIGMCLALTACGQPDPAKEAAKVVATVGGTNITKGEALEVYDFVTKQTIAMYTQYYGIAVDPSEKEFVSSMKSETLNLMAETVGMEKKLAEVGLALSDEEKAKLDADADAEYESIVQSYVSTYGLEEEVARTTADDQGFSRFALRYIMGRNAVTEKLRAYAVADLVLTDEEIKSEYDHLVADAASSYASTPAQFGTDVLSGMTVYSRPEGYRYVKNLVIGLPEEIKTKVTAKQQELFEAMYQEYIAQGELTDTTLTDEKKAEYQAQIDAAKADTARLEEELKALIQEGQNAVRPKAEEVLALAKAEGADFDALMAEHSVDTPTNQTIVDNGYPVSAASTSYVSEFTAGAMALANVGDVSDLVASDYGFHILKYTSDVAPGAVPYEEVKTEVDAHALEHKEGEVFEAKITEWLKLYNIKTYISRF